jgi:hypothetical protein
MPREFPSDDIPLSFGGRDRTIGEARDRLENYPGLLPRDREIHEIALGAIKLVQSLVDRSHDGHQRLLPEEIAQRGRNGASDELLKIPRQSFPEDEEQNRRLLEEG